MDLEIIGIEKFADKILNESPKVVFQMGIRKSQNDIVFSDELKKLEFPSFTDFMMKRMGVPEEILENKPKRKKEEDTKDIHLVLNDNEAFSFLELLIYKKKIERSSLVEKLNQMGFKS